MTCSVNIMLLLRLSSLPVYASRPYSAASRQLQQLHSIMQTAADAANRSTQITEFAQRQLDEDIIDFSAGQPGRDLLPLDLIAAGAAHRFASEVADPFILQYGPVQGYESFRKCVAAFLTQSTQYHVDPSQLIITAGVSHGIDLAVRRLARPGDQVLVEQPTYFLAGDILRQAGVRLVPVPTCAEGLDVDALEQMLQHPQGPKPRLLYTIPVHNNPAGTTLPLHKRQQLLQLAHRHKFVIVADEVYQLLSFPDSPPPPPTMKAVEQQMLQAGLLPLDSSKIAAVSASESSSTCSAADAFTSQPVEQRTAQDDVQCGVISNSIVNDYVNSIQLPPEDSITAASRVVSLGSFSKIMAPGLRLGWIEAAPHLLIPLMLDGVLGSGGSIAPLASGIAHSCLELGLLQRHLHTVIKPRLQRGCEALTNALRAEMPECKFEQPLGGYFVWLDLGTGVCSQELLSVAEQQHKVRFVPGKACDGHPHMARLSFAFYRPDELEEGVRRLSVALLDYKAGLR